MKDEQWLEFLYTIDALSTANIVKKAVRFWALFTQIESICLNRRQKGDDRSEDAFRKSKSAGCRPSPGIAHSARWGMDYCAPIKLPGYSSAARSKTGSGTDYPRLTNSTAPAGEPHLPRPVTDAVREMG